MKRMGPHHIREVCTESLSADFVVVGGGMAGTCCAITAARAGLNVVLIQDRPVLGGNASSEVRLWILGATSHMGNNNRWAREGGVIDEILVENLYRNPDGNPVILDSLLLEKVVEEPNIHLLLNTCVFELNKSNPDTISSVRAFCSQNSTMYEVRAPLFCDASGDGIVGFMAGAAFRMGAESRDEFGEGFGPTTEYGELLGHSLYFYTKDVGKPVRYVPPSFALKDITAIPRWRSFNTKEHGCQLWWIEYGGRLDTVHDTEKIKWELWKIVYGVWDHIKNSGQFPESETLTLEWVGQIPGKRESRRFEGDYILIQQDIVEQRRHYDAVSFGGWAIDLHPADGVFSEIPGCAQWHSKGVYQIPYRSMYSRNISNLFLAGRIISASHVAFASSRVMATCAHNAQAVGAAAAICNRDQLLPRDLADAERISHLQRDLLRRGQHIPQMDMDDKDDLATSAAVSSSSVMQIQEFASNGTFQSLDRSRAMLIPVAPGAVPRIRFRARTSNETTLTIQLRACSREASFTPDEILSETIVQLGSTQENDSLSRSSEQAASVGGTAVVVEPSVTSSPSTAQHVAVKFDDVIESPRYVMVCLMENPDVSVEISNERVTGLLSLTRGAHSAVSTSPVQSPPPGIGIETLEFWLPKRRPGGENLAMAFEPPLHPFAAENIICGPERPTSVTNAWVASRHDESPWIELEWNQPQTIRQVIVCLDTDFDHPMESVLMGHPETKIPFCAETIRLRDEQGNILAEKHDNHQTRCPFSIEPVTTGKLRIELEGSGDGAPIGLFRVRVF